MPHRRWSLQLVWLIPIVAALIGGWLAVKAVLERGPTITISFSTAEGLEAGKTSVKYRDVDVGRVTNIGFSYDRRRVIVTVQMTKEAEGLLVEDTRFWVVRPRITGAQISGLGTLLSGSHIGMDAGKSHEPQRTFEGLDVPPVITIDRPGRHFELRADDLGSVDTGSPVYLRRVEVGQVVAYQLAKDGSGVQVRVFINSPYHLKVKPGTRFWQASGLDLAFDAGGVRLNTESLVSVLIGGIAFETLPESANAPPARENASFTLYPSRGIAMRLPDTAEESYQVVFGESVRGLAVGAPVDFRGVVVGEVAAIDVGLDRKDGQVRVAVELKLYPDRLRGKSGNAQAAAPGRLVERLVGQGLRAQLRSGNLLTGQLYVALDFFPGKPKASIVKRGGRPAIPTVPSTSGELQTTLLSLAHKLEKLPLEETLVDARASLQALERTLGATERAMSRIDKELAPQATQALADLGRTLSALEKTLASAERSLAGLEGALAPDAPVQRDVRATLRELTRAAEALRSLADFLERNPGAILRGGAQEPAP